MQVQKFFHLDCSPIILECGYRCEKCIQEILFALRGMDGVLDVSTGKHGEISGIVVQYDSEKTAEDFLMNAFSRLTSFYKGRFVPKVMDAYEVAAAEAEWAFRLALTLGGDNLWEKEKHRTLRNRFNSDMAEKRRRYQ